MDPNVNNEIIARSENTKRFYGFGLEPYDDKASFPGRVWWNAKRVIRLPISFFDRRLRCHDPLTNGSIVGWLLTAISTYGLFMAGRHLLTSTSDGDGVNASATQLQDRRFREPLGKGLESIHARKSRTHLDSPQGHAEAALHSVQALQAKLAELQSGLKKCSQAKEELATAMEYFEEWKTQREWDVEVCHRSLATLDVSRIEEALKRRTELERKEDYERGFAAGQVHCPAAAEEGDHGSTGEESGS